MYPADKPKYCFKHKDVGITVYNSPKEFVRYVDGPKPPTLKERIIKFIFG